MTRRVSQAAAILGALGASKGGQSTSKVKQATARLNGAKGGRPPASLAVRAKRAGIVLAKGQVPWEIVGPCLRDGYGKGCSWNGSKSPRCRACGEARYFAAEG